MRKELIAASAEPLILSLLAKGESYGYAIIQEIKARSDNQLQWTDGMLYPVLHRMEHKGWIKSRWVESENGRKRKYYSIKQGGRKAQPPAGSQGAGSEPRAQRRQRHGEDQQPAHAAVGIAGTEHTEHPQQVAKRVAVARKARAQTDPPGGGMVPDFGEAQ